jgi:hypothetical protein
LKYLNLSNNNLKTSNITSIISELKKLERLNISHNQIEFLILDHPHESLTNLELDSNKLIAIEFKEKFQSLKYISACSNKLESLSVGSEGREILLPNLETLLFSDNTIDKTEFFSDLKSTKLQNLNFKNNYLYKFFVNLNKESDYSNLENIELSCNNLNEFSVNFNFPYNSLNNKNKNFLPCIKSIYLDNNKLTNINLDFLNKNFIKTPGTIDSFPNFNVFKNLEVFDVNNNLLQNPKFLSSLIPTNLLYLNISFNNFNNYHEILQILKNLKNLKELTTLENNFNKNFYDIQLLGGKTFDCIFDYLKFFENDREFNYMIKGNMSKVLSGSKSSKDHSLGFKELLDFRAYSIIKIPSLNKLDTILISERERKSVLDCAKDNNYLKKSINKDGSIINFSQEKSLRDDVKLSNKSVKVSEINEENIEKEKINFPLSENNRCETIPIIIEAPLKNEIQEQTKITIETKNLENHKTHKITDKKTEVPSPLPSQINPEYAKVYNMIKKTFFRICDKNGYMRFPDCFNLIKDLSRFYSLNNEMKLFVKDLNQMALAESNIFPGKIHFKEFTAHLKNEKFENIFKIIRERLNNISMKDKNFETKVENKTEQPGCEKIKKEKIYEKNNIPNVEKDTKMKEINSNKSKQAEIKKEKSYPVQEIQDKNKFKSNYTLSTEKKLISQNKNHTPIKTPLLSKKNSNPQSNLHSLSNSQKLNSNEKFKENESKNILLLLQSQMVNMSQSNINTSFNTLDLNNKFYIQKLLYYFAIPPFPIKYSTFNKKFLYEIYSYEKEYQFICNVFKNYNIDKFNLKKFYCQEYYYKVLEGYDSPDFIFENNIYLFYGLYDELLQSFINPDEECEDERKNEFDNYSIRNNFSKSQEHEVILDENLEKLFMKFSIDKTSNSNKFVIYLLIQKSLLNNEAGESINKAKTLRSGCKSR